MVKADASSRLLARSKFIIGRSARNTDKNAQSIWNCSSVENVYPQRTRRPWTQFFAKTSQGHQRAGTRYSAAATGNCDNCWLIPSPIPTDRCTISQRPVLSIKNDKRSGDIFSSDCDTSTQLFVPIRKYPPRHWWQVQQNKRDQTATMITKTRENNRRRRRHQTRATRRLTEHWVIGGNSWNCCPSVRYR